MPYYGFSINFTAHAGKRDELVKILLESARQLENNPHCIHYIIGTDDGPDTVRVYETWTSREAHDAALDPPEAKKLIQKAMPLIASVSGQINTDIAGGKGL